MTRCALRSNDSVHPIKHKITNHKYDNNNSQLCLNPGKVISLCETSNFCVSIQQMLSDTLGYISFKILLFVCLH